MLHRCLWRLLANNKEVFDKEWVIAPATVSVAPSAIRLYGETEKITAYGPATNRQNEQARINGGRREHAATIARMMRNALVYEDHVYKKHVKIQIGIKAEKWISKKQHLTEMESAALACSWSDSKYFGHWVTDGIPLLMAASELAPPIRNTASMSLHQNQYLSVLGMHYAAFAAGTIRELIVLEDFGQNTYKRNRYEKIRKIFQGNEPASTHPGAFILRGRSGVARILVNEDQVAQYLLSTGFKIIDPQRQSAGDMMALIRGARIVVGVEGSHLAHGLFSMAPEGTLLVLQPPYLFNNVHKDYTDCMDLKYAFMLGDACDGGFKISMDRLKKTLELIG